MDLRSWREPFIRMRLNRNSMGFYKRRGYFRVVFSGMILGLVFLMILATTVGAADISFGTSLRIILNELPWGDRFIDVQGLEEKYRVIVLTIRLPRILLSVVVGMGLSVVGASFQGLFKNPMADPYIIGVSSGAALGASAGITLFSSRILTVQTMAFLGALLTVVLVFQIAKVGRKIPAITLILSGMAISAMASALISMLMIFHRDQANQIIFWTMGSVASAKWADLLFVLPLVLFSSVAIYGFRRELNLMLSGEDTAHNLGVEVEKLKTGLLLLTSLTVAVIVSVSGIIGFVGLIVPHGVRMLFGGDHRVLIPFSAIGGAIFLLLSDTLARTLLAPMEIPVGAITALLGAPYFIYLLYQSKKKGGFG